MSLANFRKSDIDLPRPNGIRLKLLINEANFNYSLCGNVQFSHAPF